MGRLFDIDDFGLVESGHVVGGRLGELSAGPGGELCGYELLGLGGVEIAHEEEGHVVGHIVGVEELLHLAGLRIFKVVGEADDVAAVGVAAKGLGEDVVREIVDGLVFVHVLFLVDGLENAWEKTEDGIAETLDIDIHPVCQLVGREGVVVEGVVVGCAGVEVCAPHSLKYGIHLVGDGVFGSLDVEAVDFELNIVALTGVGGGAEAVVGEADTVEVATFDGPVGGAYAVGAFEHDVFEIVGDTCGGGFLVFAAGMDEDTAVDFGLVVVFTKDDFEAIVEMVGVDFDMLLSADSQCEKQ